MWKKITLVSLCLGLVVGCGDKDAAQVEAIDNSAGDGKQQVAEQKSGTAIYLPGGAGIDFRSKPISSSVVSDRGVEYQLMVYELESDHKLIDKAVSELLIADGYDRKEESDPAYELRVVYHKQGFDRVLFRYRVEAKEGFSKKTRLVTWWRKDI